MDVDVLVCGGGCAGLAAAVAAGRSGATTMLIERAPFCGGIMTTVGLPGMDGIADWGTGRILVRGVALEMLVRMGLCAPTVERIEDIAGRVRHDRHGSIFVENVERIKLVADDLLLEAGVRPLYHAIACGAEVRQGRITAVTVATKAGLLRVRPRVVIDCTGDADVATFAGAPVDPGEARMPMTLHFRIGHVGPPEQGFWDDAAEALAQAHRDGALPMYYGPGLARCFAEDEVYIHAVRVPGDARDPFDLTRAEIQGRRDAWTMWRYWRERVAAFRDSYVIGSGPYIGVRETRRIIGAYVLTEADVRAARPFDDAVATGCWYMDVHPNRTTHRGASAPDDPNTPSTSTRAWGTPATAAQGARESVESGVHPPPREIGPPRPYDIPFRTLVAGGVENLLVAGRCHSATRLAASSTRVTVTAMALGQAAGVAAGMAVAEGMPIAGMDGIRVRERLAQLGAGAFTDPSSSRQALR